MRETPYYITRNAKGLHLTNNMNSTTAKAITHMGARIWNDSKIDKNTSFNKFKKSATEFVLRNVDRV
jgi:hypothetical protein